MAGSTSSSSSSTTPLIISATDPTYISLLTLLSSPASSSRHLNLLPPSGLYGSITLYLARLDTTTSTSQEFTTSPFESFVEKLLTSQSLWHVPTFLHTESDQGRIHEDITQTPANPSLLNRVYHLHLATARAVFSKIEALLLQRNGSVGWGTQSQLKKWAELVVKATATSAGDDQDVVLRRFAILTGLAVGLGAYRQQKRQKQSQPNTTSEGLNVSRAFYAIQTHWINSFHDVLDSHLPNQNTGKESEGDEWEKEFVQVSNQDDTLSLLGPVLLAAQVSPYLSDRALSMLKPESILALFPRVLFPLFQRPLLTISQDVSQITTPQTHVLYPLLGPLSRILAAAGENALLKLSLQDVQRVLLGDEQAEVGILTEMSNLSGLLHRSFLSHQPLDHMPDNTEESLTNLWTSLKAFLFISIQFFDSLLDGIVEVLPSPVYTLKNEEQYLQDKKEQSLSMMRTSNIPPVLTTILITQVESMMRLGFITFSVTNPAQQQQQVKGKGEDPRKITSNDLYDRFSTYRRAFYGSLEVIKSDLGASVELLERLQQYLPSDTSSITSPSEWLARAHLTIYLDASEQLISILPSTLISSQIIPYAQPYLLNADYPSLFESAHSCLLSIFESKSTSPDLCIQLMPYYLEVLLKSFPHHLSSSQLSHTLSTIMSCMSNIDDARCYYIVEKLEEVIKHSPRGLSFHPDQPQQQQPEESWKETRLQFQLAYIDLLPYVNLVLLRSLLHTIEAWILEARHGGDDEGRSQLSGRTFKALSGMDDTARQEGVRWWLDKRESFGV